MRSLEIPLWRYSFRGCVDFHHLEPFCGRERSREAGEREPAGEILSGAPRPRRFCAGWGWTPRLAEEESKDLLLRPLFRPKPVMAAKGGTIITTPAPPPRWSARCRSPCAPRSQRSLQTAMAADKSLSPSSLDETSQTPAYLIWRLCPSHELLPPGRTM